MSIHVPIALVCYEKLEDGTEKIIGVFESLIEAKKWAGENLIMNSEAVGWSAALNKYHEIRNRPKYKNTHRYRFSYVNVSPELNSYPKAEGDNQSNELIKTPAPFVCYEKLNDGSEKIIGKFKSKVEALTWSLDNKIMGHTVFGWTIKNNDYISYNSKCKMYPNRHLYRFAKISL